MTVGIVIIGRNEGLRLVRCLQSIGFGYPIVYVDSGSSDGSVAAALAQGARVVALDMANPFTAARARNAGLALLPPHCELVQFIDGDCILQPGWLDAAVAALTQNKALAAAFGRRREIAPESSVYNWLCDREWAVPPGPARYFGGDVMLRRTALEQVGGYPAEMIAGEEPDLSIRLRARGWQLICLAHDMTLHDADMTRIGQWWRRSMRAGHAYAELAVRHSGPSSDYRRRLAGVLWWGAGVPSLAIFALLLAFVISDPVLAIAGGGLLLLPLLQLARLALREMPRNGARNGALLALFLMLAKPAQTMGFARYWIARLAGRRARIIEYKDGSA